MTAIVGLVDGGRVYMGADSVASDGYDITIRGDRKMFRRGAYVIGFTSSYRMGQLLQHRADLPTPWEWEHDIHAFMATRFVDAVRECLKEYGYAHVENNEQRGGTFLVGFRGGLYRVSGDYQVAIAAAGYDAVGSGDSYALGSLHTTANYADAMIPSERIRMALEAAHALSAYVRPPFHFESE